MSAPGVDVFHVIGVIIFLSLLYLAARGVTTNWKKGWYTCYFLTAFFFFLFETASYVWAIRRPRYGWEDYIDSYTMTVVAIGLVIIVIPLMILMGVALFCHIGCVRRPLLRGLKIVFVLWIGAGYMAMICVILGFRGAPDPLFGRHQLTNWGSFSLKQHRAGKAGHVVR